MTSRPALDALDLALLTALREHPRAGALELSRITGVARATVSARLQRLVLQPHFNVRASSGVVAAACAGLVSAAPA